MNVIFMVDQKDVCCDCGLRAPAVQTAAAFVLVAVLLAVMVLA